MARRYEACNRIREFLNAMMDEPMYDLDAINPALSTNVRAVRTVKVREGRRWTKRGGRGANLATSAACGGWGRVLIRACANRLATCSRTS